MKEKNERGKRESKLLSAAKTGEAKMTKKMKTAGVVDDDDGVNKAADDG